MRKIIRKCFWAWDLDKEEIWLNEMDKKGLQLISVGYFRYEFQTESEEEYVYRLELLENMPEHPKSQEYISFVESTGAEYIGSVMRWAYFRKKKTDGDFEMFSDIDSRINHLQRILLLIGVLIPIELFIGVYNLCLYFFVHAMTVNLVAGIFLMLVGIWLLCGYVSIRRRKVKLQIERTLHE